MFVRMQRYRKGRDWYVAEQIFAVASYTHRRMNPTLIASSTGLLLKTAGLKVTAIKIDPYMNIDAGTMAPTEHGQ